MIRCSQRRIGIQFHPNCPAHIKKRIFINQFSNASPDNEHSSPYCDQEWVTRTDQRVLGWWIPMVGFFSDDDIRAFKKRVCATTSRILKKINR
jgi:hypothetical protein